MSNRRITVTGTGKISIRPDLITISIEIIATQPDYEKTMDLADKQITWLQTSLLKCGFEKHDLKTSDFSVDTEYDDKRDILGNYKKILKGFQCRHRLTIKFGMDMNRLAITLLELTQCEAKPKFSISFSLRDIESAKNELLENAVINANQNAEILAKSVGLKLKNILDINYNWSEIHFSSKTRYRDKNFDIFDEPELSVEDLLASTQLEIEPENIEAKDSVTIVWEIE